MMGKRMVASTIYTACLLADMQVTKREPHMYLETLPVIYDCYQDNWGWMTASMQARAAEFAPDPDYR